MMGIMIELKATCPACEGWIAVNGLVPGAACNGCGKVRELSPDWWKALMQNVLKEAPRAKPGKVFHYSETVTSYEIKFERRHPRFPETERDIDMDAAVAGAVDGRFPDPATGRPLSVRPVPEEYREGLPGVRTIVSEDLDCLSRATGSVQPVQTLQPQGPQPFACPHCGAALTIDGKERKIRCAFCSADAYLPNEMWQKLHPAYAATPWYLWYDERHAPLAWDGKAWDAVVDGEGNLYLTLESRVAGVDVLLVACIDRTWRMKWARYGLDCNAIPIILDKEGRILLWSGDTNAFKILSAENGSDVERPEKADGSQPKGDARSSMKDFTLLAVDVDGTLIGRRNLGEAGGDLAGLQRFRRIETTIHDELCGPARFDPSGAELPFWPEPKKGKLFKKMKVFFSSLGDVPYVSEIGDRFLRMHESYFRLSVGREGSYFFLFAKTLIRFDREGRKIYAVELPCDGTEGKACADEEGNAFVIGVDRHNLDAASILRVSPDGKKIDVFVPSVLDGGGMCTGMVLALSPDRTIHVIGYGGCMRVFSAEGKLVHASAKSIEEEKELLEKARKGKR